MAKQRMTKPTTKKHRETWPERFLAALADVGVVTYAAKLAGISRQTVYVHREKHPSFAQAMDDAIEEACEVLEVEAQRRACKGVKKPVFQGKEKVGEVTEYSDTLLIFLLKARNPERFRDNHTVHHSGSMRHEVSTQIDLSKLSDGDLDALEEICRRAALPSAELAGANPNGEGSPTPA